MKKILCLLLALVLLVSGALAEGDTQTQTVDLSSYLIVLHTNDLAGDPQAGLGLSKVSLVKARFEQAGAKVLLLDAGNWLGGSEGSWLDQGEGMTALMRDAGYAAANVGAGEYAYGLARLRELKLTAGEMRLPGDSVQTEGDVPEKDVVLTDVAGLKVGLFAVTGQGAAEGCTFSDPLITAQACALALEEQGCDLIVGLCAADDETARQIAAQTDGIDLLLCAGGEAFQGGEWSESGTLLSQAGKGLSPIGCVAIDSQGNATAMTLDASYFDEGATDADFDAKVSEALAAQQAKKAEVIATVPAALSGENSDAAQTALGSWAADAVKAQTGADAVLLSGVSLGAQIPAGEATRQTILDAFPGETGLIRTTLTGAQLKALLEQAVEAYPEKSERFLQVSGLTFSIDPAQQAGSRVHDVKVNGAALDENAQYTVVCTADAALEGAQNCGVLSWTLCDALAGGAAQFTGEPMEARINEAALPTAEPTAESAATDQPNG